MRLVLLGPPGAGKGTQCRFLEERLRLPQISTGDILRDAVRAGTALGRRAREFMERGELVPDEVMIGIVEERLSRADREQGFVLDGFPRTLPQAEALDRILAGAGVRLDAALTFRVGRDELIRRLAGRRTCRRCGRMFHVEFDPPSTPGRCDRCGGELFQREDDREETVAARLEVYERRTAPVLEYFRRQGILREIDGTGTAEDVYDRIVRSLGTSGR